MLSNISVAIKLADYVGSILSYIVVGIPIFAGWYDDLSPTDLSALISKVGILPTYLCFASLLY